MMIDFFIFISYTIGASVGAAVGSFLGVVIERNGKLKVEKGKIKKWKVESGKWKDRMHFSFFSTFIFHLSSSFVGRSMCLNCKHQLPWWENIPVVSFIFLRGRCSRCRSPIPSWLPLIEIAGAAVGVWLAHWASQTIIVINFITVIKVISAFAIAIAMIWIFFSDLVYGVISDWAVAVGSVGAVIWNMSRMGLMSQIWPMVSAALGAAAFFWLLVMITRGRGMGSGDITLSFFLGLLLGWPLILVGVWLAFVIGAICGIGLIAIRKKKFGQTIPFGPFLIIGALVSFGWGQFFIDKWLWFVIK